MFTFFSTLTETPFDISDVATDTDVDGDGSLSAEAEFSKFIVLERKTFE